MNKDDFVELQDTEFVMNALNSGKKLSFIHASSVHSHDLHNDGMSGRHHRPTDPQPTLSDSAQDAGEYTVSKSSTALGPVHEEGTDSMQGKPGDEQLGSEVESGKVSVVKVKFGSRSQVFQGQRSDRPPASGVEVASGDYMPVSYTHLTLPTIYSV